MTTPATLSASPARPDAVPRPAAPARPIQPSTFRRLAVLENVSLEK